MLLALLALAADPVALAPTSKWSVESGDTMCRLLRDYGHGADKVTLELRGVAMLSNPILNLRIPGSGPTGNGHAEVTLLPATTPVTGTYLRYAVADPTGRQTLVNLDPGTLDGLGQANAIEIRLDTEAYRLAVPEIAGSLQALETCRADLARRWGIDVDESAHIAKLAKGNPARFFNADSWPPEAVRRHLHGHVTTILLIGVTGKVEQCKVVVSSKSQTLDEATCRKLLADGQFVPAVGKNGQPVASHYMAAVNWTPS